MYQSFSQFDYYLSILIILETYVVLLLLGDNRNDVYITLEKGEYDKGTKTAQRNIEVCVVVVKDNGELKKVCWFNRLDRLLVRLLMLDPLKKRTGYI